MYSFKNAKFLKHVFAGPGRPPLKRRRTSSVATSGSKNDEDELDSPQEPTRKRKKLDPVSTMQVANCKKIN